jgi:hypothetical protein
MLWRKNLRCYAQHREGIWQAVCIDLNLAAQDKKLSVARKKLHEQILSYVKDAFTIDQAHAKQLLNRKAPWSLRLEYYRAFLYQELVTAKDGYRRFTEPLPHFAHA